MEIQFSQIEQDKKESSESMMMIDTCNVGKKRKNPLHGTQWFHFVRQPMKDFYVTLKGLHELFYQNQLRDL